MALMMKMKKLRETSPELPSYATMGSAGMDLRADLTGGVKLYTSVGGETTLPADAEYVVIPPTGRALIPTGISVEVPNGYELQVRPRSGLALKNGVTVLNSPGTVDADYRGEVGVILINHGFFPFTMKTGDRIAQAVVAKVERPIIDVVPTLTETERGAGGFGSTGKQ